MSRRGSQSFFTMVSYSQRFIELGIPLRSAWTIQLPGWCSWWAIQHKCFASTCNKPTVIQRGGLGKGWRKVHECVSKAGDDRMDELYTSSPLTSRGIMRSRTTDFRIGNIMFAGKLPTAINLGFGFWYLYGLSLEYHWVRRICGLERLTSARTCSFSFCSSATANPSEMTAINICSNTTKKVL